MQLKDALEVAAATHAGTVRNFNEDSLLWDTRIGLMVLADGMGGHKAGDVASHMATEMLLAEMRDKLEQMQPADDDHAGFALQSQLLKVSIDRINLSVFKAAQADHQYRGMGTTLATALFYDNRVTLAHVGDSRIYRLRERRLELLTTDHTLLRDQVAHGVIEAEDACDSHNRALVTRALGVGEAVETDLREASVEPGDIYVLCSDGLNDMVEDSDIELIVRELAPNLQLAADVLVQAANDNGGLDNVSVILVKVIGPFATETVPHGLFDRIKSWFG